MRIPSLPGWLRPQSVRRSPVSSRIQPDIPTGGMAKLAKDAGWALAGRVLSKVAAVVVIATLARALDRADLGRYLLILSVAGGFSLLADMGVSQAVVVLVARVDTEADRSLALRTVAAAWHVVLLGGAAACILAATPIGRGLVGLLGGGTGQTVSLGLGVMVGLLAIAKAAQLLAGEMFRGFGDVRAASLHGELLPSVTMAMGMVAAALILPSLALPAALGIATLAPALMVGVSSLAFRRAYGHGASAAEARTSRADRYLPSSKIAVLRTSWPLLGHRLAMYVATQMDLWVVGALLGASAIAGYGAAAKLLILIDLPLVVVNLALAPRIARYLHEGRDVELQDEIRRVATFVGLLGWIGLAVVVLARAPLLDVVFGPGYSATAGQVLTILAVGHAVFYWSGPSAMTLIMGGQQQLLLWISILSAGMIAGLAILFGEAVGIRGVALAAASGTIVHNSLTWWGVKQRLRLRTDVRIGALRELSVGLRQFIPGPGGRRKRDPTEDRNSCS